MRLLFAIKSMAWSKGGAERVFSRVTSELVEFGHEVVAVTFDAPNAKARYNCNRKIRWRRLDVGDSSDKTSISEFVREVRALRQCLKAEVPDVVVAFMHSMYVPTVFASCGTGIPVIVSEHNVPESYSGKPCEYMLLNIAAMMASRVTVVSESAKSSYPLWLRRKMSVIWNPVEDYSCKMPRKTRDLNSAVTILSVGRLAFQKDHASLVRAFGYVAAEFPSVRLRIVGDGPLLDDLKGLVRECNLEGKVELASSTDRIEDEYASADIFAASSRYESFGLAAAEAMLCGIPVIGFSDCAGINEIVKDNESGILVNERDRVKGLTNGLRRLVGDAELRKRLGRNAARLMEEYRAYEIADAWNRLVRVIPPEKSGAG